MSNTLVQYEQLSTDELIKGIAKSIYVVSPWLRELPFAPVKGNSHKYNLQTTAAAADFYDVGELIVEGTPTFETRYADLAILIGDADVDLFSAAVSQQDLAAEIIRLKGEAIAQRFNQCAVLGRTTSVATYSSTKIFKGLAQLIAECESSTTTDLDGLNNPQVIPLSATSAALTLDYVDELVDAVKPYPTHLVMSQRTQRKLTSLLRATGQNMQHHDNQAGYPIERWGNLTIWEDDAIKDNVQDGAASVLNIAAYNPTTTRAAGNDNSLIFAVRLGDGALRGITSHENGMVRVEAIGKLENKDAERTRIKFYCGLELLSKRAAAVLINFTDS
jgi:hypothetical protein